MANESNGTKYLTWRGFTTVCLGIIAVPIIVNWLLLSVVRDDIREMRQELQGDIQKLEEKIDKIHPPTP